ncbi:MAG TPA: hypothetical protein PLN21_14850 [Gemmatales bacterium]|nr:hypothetical protein [Gemmatales bacterium]
MTRTLERWGAVSTGEPSLISRVVGTLEYLSALRNLDAFLQAASREELAAADKFVSSRPQFTVFTQLADRFKQGPGTAQTSPAAQQASQKRGLMWVVALARLEAGAILATFTTLSTPFEMVGPTKWELPAYKELLMDGAQTHYLALANDSNVATVALKLPDTETLAYIRRLNLARSMLSAAARSNAAELSPHDWSELEVEDRQLLATRDRFVLRVNKSLNSYSKESKTITGEQYTTMKTCILALRGEQVELAAGTAWKQTIKPK